MYLFFFAYIQRGKKITLGVVMKPILVEHT